MLEAPLVAKLQVDIHRAAEALTDFLFGTSRHCSAEASKVLDMDMVPKIQACWQFLSMSQWACTIFQRRAVPTEIVPIFLQGYQHARLLVCAVQQSDVDTHKWSSKSYHLAPLESPSSSKQLCYGHCLAT